MFYFRKVRDTKKYRFENITKADNYYIENLNT